jgi:hypothetical protein
MPSIDETLGQYSELFILLAAMAYTVAFIAFCWDLATSSKTIRSVESRLAREQSEQKVLAGAGGGAPAGSAGKAGADTSVETADEAMVYTKERRVAARIGVAITIVAALVHAAGVISRAITAIETWMISQ